MPCHHTPRCIRGPPSSTSAKRIWRASGRETRGRLSQLGAAANDNADAALADARRWRNLARARRAAGWVNVRDEALLTRLAEEYEARATQAEARQSARV
jgi:hypothetical protein